MIVMLAIYLYLMSKIKWWCWWWIGDVLHLL